MKITNGELYGANEALGRLAEIKLPVKTSLQVAKLANKVGEKLKPVEEVKKGLVKTYEIYSEPNERGGEVIKTKGDEKNLEKFASEFNELLLQEDNLEFEKIRMPEKIAGTCDACHHNMDVSLQIEPSILIALEKFVEVV